MATSGSGTHAFARHMLVYEWNVANQSIPNNTSTVTCKIFLQSVDQYGAMIAPVVNSGYLIVNGERKDYTATSDLSAYQKKLLFAANWVIGHNANGTKDFKVTANYNVNVTFNGVYYGSTTWEGFGTLNTIPRTSSVSVSPSTLNFGDWTRIHINRASGSFTHTLTFQWYGNNNTFANRINFVDYDFSPNIDLSRYIPNGTSGWGTIVCDTYSGGTKIGSSSARLTVNTVNDGRFQPVVNDFTMSEANGEVTTAVGSVYVQSKSKLKVQADVSSKMYSSISKVETKVGNAVYVGNPITSGFIAESGTLNVVVTATDSRGYKASKTKSIYLASYSNPKINSFSAIRRQDAQEIVDIKWSCNTKAIGVDNGMGYNVEYQGAGGAWTSISSGWNTTQEWWNGSLSRDSINIDKVFNFRITAYDEFMSTSSTQAVPVARVPMSWGTTGVSVGKVFEEGGASFQLGGNMSINGRMLIDIFYPVGSIFESTSSENPSNFMGGNWERFGNGRITVGVDEGDWLLNGGNKQVGSVNPLSYHTHQLKMVINGGSNVQGGVKYGLKFEGNQAWRVGDLTEISTFNNNLPSGQTGAVAKGSGDNTNHNNWQPSVSVYRWRRTA